MVSPGLASAMALRSDPTPSSALLVTVSTAGASRDSRCSSIGLNWKGRRLFGGGRRDMKFLNVCHILGAPRKRVINPPAPKPNFAERRGDHKMRPAKDTSNPSTLLNEISFAL